MPDTSGPVCGVAILTEDGIRHECAVMNHKTHSVNLLPMIDNAFQSTGLTIQDMDRLAVVVGPGSFTGVRLGVSTVMADTPMKVEDYVAEISRFGDRFLFLGDGMPVHRQKLQTLLGDAATFAQPHQAFLRPAAVAYLASLETETVDYLTLMPLYLRAPNAALNKKLTEGLHA